MLLKSVIQFATMYTGLWTSQLYTANPEADTISPMNSQMDTPSDLPSRH